MSQRKAKEYRRAMEQYTGVAEDVDDLKRRVGALEARHYREDRDKAVDMIQRRAAAKKWEETVKARAMKKAEHELKTRAEERRRRIARRRLITLAWPPSSPCFHRSGPAAPKPDLPESQGPA